MINKNTVLNVENLTKTFTKPIIQEISFSLQAGEILGLLGPNGAGKTTTIQMLLGTLSPTSGSINYFNSNFFTHRSACLQKIGFASTYVNMPQRLTVYENLKIQAMLYGFKGNNLHNALTKYIELFKLHDLMQKQFGELSAGQKTRAMLAKAFITNPEIVLLDEPTASLDPDVAEQIRSFIVTMRNEYNIAVLLTSHNMQEVASICDRVVVLQHGHIIANAQPSILAASIASSRIELLITDNLTTLMTMLRTHNIPHTQINNLVEIQVNEEDIAQLLHSIATQGIMYSKISIKKPSLEEYFLHIAQQSLL